MKIYCRQIAPEYQESPLFTVSEYWPEGITVTGNRNFQSRETEEFTAVYKALENGDFETLIDWQENGYESRLDALHDMLTVGKDTYTPEELDALQGLAKAYYKASSTQENEIICKTLEIITGRAYDWQTIRGTCQSDWQELFYPAEEWTAEQIRVFEIEYFNTGSEWIIHDNKTEPEGPENICGYSVYIHAWDADGIRKELASVAGCKAEELVLFAFESWTRTPVYKAV